MSHLQTETLLPPDASNLSSLVIGSSNAAETIFHRPAIHSGSENTIISEFAASIKPENGVDHVYQNGKSTTQQNNGRDEQEALTVLSSSHSSNDVEDALLLQELAKASRSPSVSTSNGTSCNMSTPTFDKPLKMKLKEENVKLPKKKRKTYLDEIQQNNGKQNPTNDEDDEREAHNNRNFEYVEENIYLGDSTVFQWKNLFDDDIIMCMCGPNRKNGEVGGDDHCGESCVNRVLCMECVLGHCACGSKCTNNRFQKKSWKKITVKKAGEKGYGIFANERIPKGSFIIEYVGEVLDEKIYKQRQEAYDGERHYYFLSVGPNQIIDASKKGNNARFINHSCDPNSVLQKWTVGHQSRIGVFALRDIEKGEEITFDYAMECYGVSLQKCYCGSKNCRGTITSKEAASLLDLKEKNSNLDKERNKRIKNHKLDSKFKQRTLYTLKILEDNNKLPKDVQDAADFGNVCLLRNMRKVQQKRFRQFLSIEKQISDQFKQNQEEEKDEFGLTEYERAQMTKIYEQIQKGNINNLNVRGFNYRRCKTRTKETTTTVQDVAFVSNEKPRVSVRGRKKSTEKMEDEAPKKRRGRPPKRKIEEAESEEESSEDDNEEDEDEEEHSASDDCDMSYDEESEEEEEASTRRKKKSTSSSSQGTTKRKVGRPRKHPLPDKPEEGKRKVGRPKKNVSQPATTDANKPSSEQSASAPVKRRVGRPRKEEVLAREREEKERKRKEKEQRELQKKKEAETNKMALSSDESTEEEEPPKRKVGRPKKNTTPTTTSNASKPEEKPLKRKVGRPKKEETLAKSTAAVSSSKPIANPQDQNRIKSKTTTSEITRKESKPNSDAKVTTLPTTPTLTSTQSLMKSPPPKIQNPFSASSSSSVTITTPSTPTKKPTTAVTEITPKKPVQTPPTTTSSSNNATASSSAFTTETRNETKASSSEKVSTLSQQQPVKRKVGRPKKEEVLAREKQKEQELKEKKQEQEKPSDDKPVVKRPRKIVHNNASSSNATKRSSSSEEESSSSESEEEKRTVKRKVGRPRKDESSSQQPPKRKVGRPRKDQSATNEARTAKKLGRPRKVIESSSESSSSEEEDDSSDTQRNEHDADIEVARKFNIRLSKVKAYQGISTSIPKRKYTKHADKHNEQ
ncbi:hypothetical protein FDP41_000077 [Naegleria fowleri]|uniref:Histone-lysine N-methyltransferase n=1 Tax=Naegleria fowleri TaxID=5763 RepID=A0A6A5CII2_NAEFO|nr:uncharacterized protein FDP41_000077 [Naegleria fowleri]KAF0985038.1 hypothetical protein FDP41_000077 [Naegleria fowleri]